MTGTEIGMNSEEVIKAIEIFEQGIAPVLCDFSSANEQIIISICLVLARKIVQITNNPSTINGTDRKLLNKIEELLNNQKEPKFNIPLEKRCKITCPPGGIFFGI